MTNCVLVSRLILSKEVEYLFRVWINLVKSRPLTTIPGNTVSSLYNETLTVGSVAQGRRVLEMRIPGYFLEGSVESSHFSIPGNNQEDSGECSRRFKWILSKLLGDVVKDFREDSGRFWEMFKRIPENVQEDCGKSKFWFISWNLSCFLSIFAVKLLKKKEKKSNSSKENICFTKTYN